MNSLHLFLWFYIAMTALATLIRLLWLAYLDYPRRTEWQRHHDVLAVLLHIGFIYWASTLL